MQLERKDAVYYEIKARWFERAARTSSKLALGALLAGFLAIGEILVASATHAVPTLALWFGASFFGFAGLAVLVASLEFRVARQARAKLLTLT